MVANRPNEVHKARLRALHRNLGTRSDGNNAKVSRRIAVEMIEQMLADSRQYRFLTMYDMSHSAEPAIALATISMLIRCWKILWASISGLHGRQPE